ncbi:MAG: bifunctional (p)ppGpp synthetase/guanosine-3',5'-bis(diphosphate) 3'-pyrophosphohydrolase [Anaerolineae bacterium]|nr:bifunctional (p)ppGpp synthetase/guanosine-3',5'-bis(diphosphate) 3'-pyrophosphohydrolase [Anaerolineae bacterium]
MLFKAIEFATHAHSGQYRKGTKIPYIIHPLRVAKILIELDCAEPLVIAGVLHDTVEDTDTTLEDIRENFGDEVATLVQGMTEPDKQWSWERRKAHTLTLLRDAPMDLLLIACADKLDNIRTIREGYAKVGDAIWARFKRSREKQTWYYTALTEVFAQRMESEPGTTLFKTFVFEVQQVFGD